MRSFENLASQTETSLTSASKRCCRDWNVKLSGRAFPINGSAERTVAAVIAVAEERSPLRLALGSAAYENIERALAGRLEAVRRQKAIALGAVRQPSA